MKWDNNPVEVINSLKGGGLPFDGELLGKYSILKLSYETTKGTQLAEFDLDGNKYISEMLKKCLWF